MLKTFDPLIPDNYKPSNLQRPLEKQFGKRITILSQHGQGKSNFLFSRSITLVDAIKTANSEKQSKHEETSLQLPLQDVWSDEMIFHRAIGILRYQMETMTAENTYPSADDCTVKRSGKCIPSLVLKAALWLIDKRSYRNIVDTAPSHEVRSKACSLAHKLVYNCTNSITPIHLEILILVHHNHGSRSLIDTVHSYGSRVSYGELRR